jgi:hypothetical protein
MLEWLNVMVNEEQICLKTVYDGCLYRNCSPLQIGSDFLALPGIAEIFSDDDVAEL